MPFPSRLSRGVNPRSEWFPGSRWKPWGSRRDSALVFSSCTCPRALPRCNVSIRLRNGHKPCPTAPAAKRRYRTVIKKILKVSLTFSWQHPRSHRSRRLYRFRRSKTLHMRRDSGDHHGIPTHFPRRIKLQISHCDLRHNDLWRRPGPSHVSLPPHSTRNANATHSSLSPVDLATLGLGETPLAARSPALRQ
ncbi:hypothetical protein Cocul_00333 [Corynebacterium oculi]|uniref:Uncharacterized protein n=1 Tax=Corynebacterium oculi TaxID=1544416 RepID=A0A0Q1AEU5_9CORY|nr:hypothetical protein Cocul_00333 [Corynebacterium oculi]